MVQTSSHLLRDLRQNPRHPVHLTGVAQFADGSTSVRVVDLSYGGARIVLPLPVEAYDMPGLRSLRIAQVLQMRVVWRWSRGTQAGVEFVTPDKARAAIAHLIDSAADGWR